MGTNLCKSAESIYLFIYLLRFVKYTVYITLFNDNKNSHDNTVGWDMASDM